MRTIAVTLCHAKSGIPIGRLGENVTTQVIFPLADLIGVFGEGTFSLLHRRPGDSAPYPCSVQRVGNSLIWVVTSADVQKMGRGECELIFTAADAIGKDVIFPTLIGRALSDTTTPPEPWESWVDAVLAAADRVEAAQEHFPKISEETGNWLVWDVESEAFIDTGIHAQGEAGTSEWDDIQNRPFSTLSSDDFSVEGGVLKTKGGGGGTSDHRQLTNRDAADSHPISSITGLRDELDSKSEFSGSYDDLTDKPTIPDELADLATDANHRTVTDSQINTWNSKATSASVTAVSNRVTDIEGKEAGWDAKYSKPSTGIPASDLAAGVIPEIPTTEEADELPVVTAIGASPSNGNVPTEKAVSDAITAAIGNIDTLMGSGVIV